MSSGTFFILGRPLQENLTPHQDFLSIISKSQLIIGESRRITERILNRLPLKEGVQLFFLDNQSPQDRKLMEKTLFQLSQENGQACLFSDMGMPILFDPGQEVLEQAKKWGMTIRCLPGPTSWGTACALSGWAPPFHLVGFVSPKNELRSQELAQFQNMPAHLVFMETPYRFRAFLTDCSKVFGQDRQAFLAWEIGTPQELYFWGCLSDIQKSAEKQGLLKGEFILLLQKPKVN